MATYEQNMRTLARIQQRRDMMTPPDPWEEEQLRAEAEDMRDEPPEEWGRFSRCKQKSPAANRANQEETTTMNSKNSTPSTNTLSIFPRTKFVDNNSIADQVEQLESETDEVSREFDRPPVNHDRVAMELFDVIHSAETALHILAEKHGVDLAAAWEHVISKNMERGYYVTRNLVVNLTEDEITRCSQELARVTTQQAELEEEKKTVTSSYKEKLDRCVSDSRSLARKISTRQDIKSEGNGCTAFEHVHECENATKDVQI